MRPSRSTSAQHWAWTSARQWATIALGALAFIVLSIPAATAQSTDSLCDDVLLQVSPTSISGDQDAVAITSQQFEADVPGWSQVSWEAAADTTLTGVIVRSEAESFTLTDGIATGTVEDALELTFCGSTAVATPDTEGSDATDENDGDTQVTQPVDDVCDDVLVTITPDSISGDETVVAITSQQLDADVVGWVSVSWEAGADTTLTGVSVRTVTGTATLIDDLQTGTVEDALELTFCGTVASDDAGEPEDDGSDEEPTEVPEPEDDGGSGGGTEADGGTTGGGGSSTGGTGSGGTGGGSAAPAPSDDDDAAPEPDPEPEPEPTPDPEPEPEPAPDPEPAEDPVEETDSDDAGAADTDDVDSDDAESDDTEVLGVQLSQDDEGSGWVVPVLLILLVAGAIGAGILVRNRYLAASGGQ